MSQITAVIQYSSDDAQALEDATAALGIMIDEWPTVIDVTQATLTAEDGTITDLLQEAAPADPAASSSASEAPAEKDTGETDPNADPNQSLPTGGEF